MRFLLKKHSTEEPKKVSNRFYFAVLLSFLKGHFATRHNPLPTSKATLTHRGARPYVCPPLWAHAKYLT